MAGAPPGKYKPPAVLGRQVMDYHDSPEATALAQRTREFVEEVVMPRERELAGRGPVPDDAIE
jgi:hypothetical protein